MTGFPPALVSAADEVAMEHQGLGANERLAPFVDGGAVLLARPYTDGQWREVRKAWWWHTVGMYFLVPYYPVIALTVWQGRSRQSLGRRVTWACLLTLSAVLLVGIPPFVVFSRRWYWLYRTQTDPAVAGVPTGRSDGAGFFPWVATRGAALVDRVMRRFGSQRAPTELHRATLAEPWSSLVVEAARAVDRIRRASARAQGPATARIADAAREASIATESARQVAAHARDIDAALRSMNVEAMEHRLAALEAAGGDPSDVDAVRRSLNVQQEAAERMRRSLTRLLGQLERLVAQLGEAAAYAEELALGVLPPGGQAHGLTYAIDGLVAVRSALDALDTAVENHGR